MLPAAAKTIFYKKKKTLILAFEAISVNFYTSIFFKFQRIVPFYCLKFGSVSKAETT